MTFEGKKLDLDHPLFDYPYPQFQRESYLCLNGRWEFEIDQSEERPAFYSKRIVVPFAPETELSGIQRVEARKLCMSMSSIRRK